MFNHLHTHSYYSLLESLNSPQDLARKAADFEMEALALTDHNHLTGAIEFYEECKSRGVKPILGLEIDIKLPKVIKVLSPELQQGKLVLLAMDLNGWSNLCRISSSTASDLEGSSNVILNFEDLAENARNIICLSGGFQSLATKLMIAGLEKSALDLTWRLAEVFPDRLYIELQNQTDLDQKVIPRLLSLSRRLNLPVVATQNVYSLSKNEQHFQRLLTAIRQNRTIKEVEKHCLLPSGSWMFAKAEMERRFKEIPEAVNATAEIARRCHLEFPEGVRRYPQLASGERINLSELLKAKAFEGAKQKYGFISTDIQKRLEHELSVIEKIDYTSLFLIMEEIVTFARRQEIPIASRGSAASSLVAFCLGITTPDPIKQGLYFERFLNLERLTPPDFDMDICSRRRDEVIDFVFRRFGEKQASMVCTINRLRRRSALREVAKAHGLSPKEINLLVKYVPGRRGRPDRARLKRTSVYENLRDRIHSADLEGIINEAEALIGIPDHHSIHPGGMVIAPNELHEIVPTLKAAKGVVITQFDLKSIERLGLVKIDLLGIRGLTVIGDVVMSVNSERSDDSGITALAYDTIPEKDFPTSLLVKDGLTIGCFQIESPGMRATLKEIRAQTIDDIMVALSLYRPGPLTGGLKDAFVRRYRKEEHASYLHSALAPILEDTYGVILYQEQVLRIAHELAGFSPSEADVLRRAMSHFDPGKQMETLKEKFIEGAHKREGVAYSVGEEIWNLMAAFAGYGFPKAHAASYAQVAWRSAWCKTHFPAIFMAAVLANWGGYYSQRVYLAEARRMGLVVKPPNVQYANREFSVKVHNSSPILFMGLNQVRGLTRRTQEQILQSRPFNNFQDFLNKVDPRPSEVENLVKSGSLADFGSIPSLLKRISYSDWGAGQMRLFSIEKEDEGDWSLKEKVAAQEEILGVSIIAHPLELISEEIREITAISTGEAAAMPGQQVSVVGLRMMWRSNKPKTGSAFYVMTLEDQDGYIDVLLSDDVYKRHHVELFQDYPLLIEGFVEIDKMSGVPNLRAQKIKAIKTN